MLINSVSVENLQLTIIRHPLIVSSEILLLDVVAILNQTQANFGNLPIKDSKSLEDSTKEIANITPEADSCVLVMDNSQLVGIFTQRDLIKLTAEGKSLKGVSVKEVMTRELVTLKIGEFKDIFTALNLLKQHRIRHLPILGKKGEVIGLVTPVTQSREWESGEIELLQQLANQLAIATQQSGLYAQLQVELNERKKAEEQICKALEKEKELSDLKSRFISMISHEFRTPLAVIASSAGILKSFSHKLDEEQKQKHLECIQTYVQHTTKLLDDILLINKAEAGKLAFEPSSFDLVDFCHTLVDKLQFSSPNHHLVFSPQYLGTSSDSNNFIAYMDKKLLGQILSDLLSNAVKYSPIHRNIQIDLLIQDKIAVFVIKDEGIGISLEDQQHLFESFYRGSNVANTPGAGLGLTIAAKCAYLHQGRITFVSQLGIGTTFRGALPLIATNAFT